MQMANRHGNRSLTSIIIMEIQIKTTMMDDFTLVRMIIIEKFTDNEC